MQAEDRGRRRRVERAALEHAEGPCGAAIGIAFFSRLEQEDHGAWNFGAHAAEEFGDAERDGDVSVVTAGVLDVGYRGLVRARRSVQEWATRPCRRGRRPPCPAGPLQDPDHTGPTDLLPDLVEAEGAKPLGDECCRARLAKAQFRVAMEVTAGVHEARRHGGGLAGQTFPDWTRKADVLGHRDGRQSGEQSGHEEGGKSHDADGNRDGVIQNAAMHSDWVSRAVSPEAAVSAIGSGMKIFVHGAAATPTTLLEALARRTDLEGVTVYHLHTAGPAPFAAPDKVDQFRSVSLFTGAPLRGAIEEGRADFVPIFLSDIPGLFLSGRVTLDAALLSLSVPDRHGFCTLGTSVDAARAAADTATLLIAEVNTQMPRTRGNVVVPIGRLDAFIANRTCAARARTRCRDRGRGSHR